MAQFTWPTTWNLLLNLIIATILGSLIAFHPQRLRRSGELDWEMKKSQVLICVMGVILVEIVQGQLALAFGLVGIGSFIRFRTAISNPVEGAIIFVQIMIGMACGGQDHWLAGIFTAFVFVLLSVLNVREPSYVQLWEVKTQGGGADACRRAFEKMAEEQAFRIERLNLDLDRQVFTARFRPSVTPDISTLDRTFVNQVQEPPKAVQWNRME